jgi:hypothetical protein
MIGMSSQISGRRVPSGFARATACVCILLWVVGSVSLVYGSLTPQWTTPHCPQGQANSGQHSHSHCVWHCDGVDEQVATGRSGGSSATPNGYVSGHLGAIPLVAVLSAGIVPRGPPQLLVGFE